MTNKFKLNAPTSRRLCLGHFHKNAGYAVYRPQGNYDWLMIYTVSGKGDIGHQNGKFTTTTGDIILMAPDAEHSYATNPAHGQWELQWSHFEPPPAWQSWLSWPTLAPGFHHLYIADLKDQLKISLHLKQAINYYSGFSLHHRSLAINALETAILLCDELNPLSPFARLDARIQHALDYICVHLHKPIDTLDIARSCGLSSSRLAHLFREQVGITPQCFLEQQRISRAQQLLESSGFNINEIAHAVGYKNPFYFSTRFHKMMKISPTAYRQQIIKHEYAKDLRPPKQ